MEESDKIIVVTDKNVKRVVEAVRGVLILTTTTCAPCEAYQADIEAHLHQGQLAGVVIGKMVLDERGGAQFKKGNPWVAGLEYLPFTVLYSKGQRVDGFAASKGSYLMERMEAAFSEVT